MLTTAFHLDGPSAIRYPRGPGTGLDAGKELLELPVGKGEIRRSGKGVASSAARTSFGRQEPPKAKPGMR